MKEKQCTKCKVVKPFSEFSEHKGHGDGLQSRCRPCAYEDSSLSAIRHPEKWFQLQGFISEKDHFNFALREYADKLNCPQILKHGTIDGPVYRYNTKGEIIETR